MQTDWQSVCPNASFIVGNPPFIGKNYRNEQQDADMARVFTGMFNTPIMKPTPRGSNPDVNHHSLRPVFTDRQTQSSGDSAEQSEAIVRSIATAQDGLVTKDYLDTRITMLEQKFEGKFNLLYWMITANTALSMFILGKLLFPH